MITVAKPFVLVVPVALITLVVLLALIVSTATTGRTERLTLYASLVVGTGGGRRKARVEHEAGEGKLKQGLVGEKSGIGEEQKAPPTPQNFRNTRAEARESATRLVGEARARIRHFFQKASREIVLFFRKCAREAAN